MRFNAVFASFIQDYILSPQKGLFSFSPIRPHSKVNRFLNVSIKQSVHKIDRLVFLAIDDFGVHLRHLHIRMTEQFRGRV